MRRLFVFIFLLILVGGLGIFPVTVFANTASLSTATLTPPFPTRTPDPSPAATEMITSTPSVLASPTPVEQTYGGYRLDYIIALGVLGALTLISLALGRAAKRKR